ncbi:hypothetical protein DPMN_145051 [Dreissena polymorpha]|uniref:Uncharacterized protein n=1 Tax=Dreissena polymorpha TaxID=45954 RepID=A0A9D4F5Y6_DREPO|nr:hypothetical protein DPMN_145051 [Dreissena polymorpha]
MNQAFFPPKKAINEEDMSDIVPGVDVSVNGDDFIMNPDDVIMYPRKRTDEAPPTALCNTVRTTSRGDIDFRGKLVEGEVCEQILVVDAEDRLLLTFDDLRMDCQDACRQQFTDVAGHLTPVQSNDVTEIEIYVIVTPGRSVQIIFKEFHMIDMTSEPGCIKVEDMEG